MIPFIEFAPYVVDAVLVVTVLALYVRVRKLRNVLAKLTATRDEVPTDPALVQSWVRAYERLKEGTPKHTAYKNRLIQIGYLER